MGAGPVCGDAASRDHPRFPSPRPGGGDNPDRSSVERLAADRAALVGADEFGPKLVESASADRRNLHVSSRPAVGRPAEQPSGSISVGGGSRRAPLISALREPPTGHVAVTVIG